MTIFEDSPDLHSEKASFDDFLCNIGIDASNNSININILFYSDICGWLRDLRKY